MPKQYDRAYFDHWYRGSNAVTSKADVARKAALALAAAEYFLRRPLRSVLDIGCGEGAWLPHLRALRPRLFYKGLDPSEYVVQRFGKARNISLAGFAELPSLRLDRKFDLIICSDVLHYVGDADIRTGVAEIARLLEGVAFLEVLTREDEVVGDLDGLKQRPADWYRKTFNATGLVQVAPYCWIGPSMQMFAAELEVP